MMNTGGAHACCDAAIDHSSSRFSDDDEDEMLPALSSLSTSAGDDQRLESLAPDSQTFRVYTSCLFDPIKKRFLENSVLTVDRSRGSIVSLTPYDAHSMQLDAGDIDLRDKCVIPGLVDAHTHIFLHAYDRTSALVQMRDESWVERIVRATNHCRAALKAGYTTYRDLGTEGVSNADASFRDTINRGIIEGPRLFVACEALAGSGGYKTQIENRIGGTETFRISDAVDGVAGVRAAVRRQIGAGADVIKFYADYRKRQMRFPPPLAVVPGAKPVDIRFPPDADDDDEQYLNPSYAQFAQDEMDEIVREAHTARTPVAAHSQNPDVAIMAAKAGVTSLEHGPSLTRDAIAALRKHDVIFVPTLATMELYNKGDAWKRVLATTKTAYDAGVRIAAGGDTGAFDHGENARELELLLEAGLPVEEVLVAATLRGWESCGGEWSGYKFGFWAKGCRADIVALDADPRRDRKAFRKVNFVMKDGEVKVKKGKWAIEL